MPRFYRHIDVFDLGPALVAALGQHSYCGILPRQQTARVSLALPEAVSSPQM